MKVAFTGLDLPEGKTKYNDPIVAALTEKFEPAKVSPYYFEFNDGDFDSAEAIAVARSHLLDVLIHDMERMEGRLERTDDPAEKAVFERCLQNLEEEKPLCDLAFEPEALAIVRGFGAISLKPVITFASETVDVDRVCEAVLEKSGRMFFYTAGKQEVHAWLVEQGADAVTCAGQIHTDLARGFIKAEVIPVDELLQTHSFQSARKEGLTRLVDRDTVIEPQTVLEIRFNV